MMVALGKNDVKTLEDLAYCAADDLVGWTESKDGETAALRGRALRLRRVAPGGGGRSSWRRGSRPASSPRPILRRRRRRKKPRRLKRRQPPFDGSAEGRHGGRSRPPRRPHAHVRGHARGAAGKRADPLRRARPTARSSPISRRSFPAAASGSARSRALVAEAVKRNVFSRGLKQPLEAGRRSSRSGGGAAQGCGARPSRPGAQGGRGCRRLRQGRGGDFGRAAGGAD